MNKIRTAETIIVVGIMLTISFTAAINTDALSISSKQVKINKNTASSFSRIGLNNKSSNDVMPAGVPSWPDSWTKIDNDPNEDGANDNYRDVQHVYYSFDSNYIYLRFHCYGTPAFRSGGREGRFKWFIDLDNDAHLQGGNIVGGEYLLFVEDTNDDDIGDIYLLNDTDDNGLFDEWEGDYNAGLINNTNIADYRIIDDNIDLYLNLSNIGNPSQIYLTWATDQENPNLDQAPTTDRPDDQDIPLGPIPVTNQPSIDVEKKVWNETSCNWEDSITTFVGDTLQFKIVITNTGQIDFTSAEAEDNLPSFLTYNYDASITPTSADDHHIEWSLGSLNAGDTVTITFSTGVTNTGDDFNSANACGYYSFNKNNILQKILSNLLDCLKNIFNLNLDPIYRVLGSDSVCDCDGVHIIARKYTQPNIQITKKVKENNNWVDGTTVYVGDNVEFKLVVENTGDVDLTNVEVVDILPFFLVYNYDANIASSSATDHQITWNLGTLNSGDSRVILFTANANTTGDGDNNVTAQGTYNCHTIEDSDTAHITVQQTLTPDVKIVKKIWNGSGWVDNIAINIGDDIKFKITVINTGNTPLDTYVKVTDNLPSFLSYNYDASITPTSADDHHIEWNNLAPLPAGDSVTITFTAHADNTGDGNNTVHVTAKYNCNPEVTDSDSAHVKVTCAGDNQPPVTTKEYGQPFYTNGTADWITSNTLIWLNATDYPLNNPSGVKATYYRILKWNGADWAVEMNWTEYTCPFTIPSECYHKIEFYSVDNACNQEEIKWQTVYVDNTPPCSSIKVTEDPDRYVSRVSTVTITSVDGGKCPVGSYTIYCYINNEFYAKVHNKKIIFQFNELYGFTEDGRYTVEYWAVDDLGNEETHHSETFTLDTTPPETDYSFDGPNRWVNNHWQIEPSTRIVLTATDSGSGVEWTKYREGYQNEGGEWKIYTEPFIPTKENIFFCSRDKVGNQENLVHLYVEIVDSIENKPPFTPEKPSGQNYGNTGDSYIYSTSTTDPEGSKVRYYFSWGDGTGGWTDYVYSGNIVTMSHVWIHAGSYQVKVKAQDEEGAESEWSEPLNVYIINKNNQPPSKPDKPSGPTSGRINVEYTYTVVTTDPEGDKIYYLIDWGDGTDSGWLGPYNSGETIEVKHKWTTKGSYQIKVKARDVFGAQSEWSDPLPITMPKSLSTTDTIGSLSKLKLLKTLLIHP